MRKKKIAILAPYVGVVNRGAETFVIELTKKLREAFNINVFSTGISDEIKENIIRVSNPKALWLKIHEYVYNKVKIYRFFCEKSYYLIPEVIEQRLFSGYLYLNYFSKTEYDLIFPNNGIFGVKMAQKIRERKGTPFIYTGHGGIGYGEKFILECNPDLYIATSEDSYKWAKKLNSNTIKIHIGVNSKKFCTQYEFTNQDQCLQKPIVLCVGAFVPFKRQKLLIDAVSLLNKGTLLLLGEGYMDTEIAQYGNEKLGNRFILKTVSYQMIPYYYQLCDVFSLPSLNEPFGIVYLEAMSANKPVVAPDDASRREIIGDAGLYCDVENPNEYAETIQLCYEKQWGNIPTNRAKKFSWDAVATEYKLVINQIIDGRT